MLEHLREYAYRCEIPPEHFAHMTDWLLQWRKRDPGMAFSLVLIDFRSPTELGNVLGAKYAMELIKRVGHEIDAALRATDLLCRTPVSCFWVLLPQGAPDMVLQKLEPILAAARQDGMDATQLRIRKLVIPDDGADDLTATELFRRLQA